MEMTILRNVILVAAVVLLCATAWVSWENRASDQVTIKALAALVASLMITLVTIVFSLESKPLHMQFETTYIFEKTNKYPFAPSSRPYVGSFTAPTSLKPVGNLVSELSRDPSKAPVAEDLDSCQSLYFDILMAGIVDQVFWLFEKSWDIDMTRSSTYFGPSRTRKDILHNDSRIVPREAMASLFDDPRVLMAEPTYPRQMAMPPGSAITQGKDESSRWFKISTPFGSITVRVSPGAIMSGIGRLGDVLNSPQELRDTLMTSSYVVTLDANFSRLRSGHPTMPLLRKWADTMLSEIQFSYDSSRLWDDFLKSHVAYSKAGTPNPYQASPRQAQK